MFLKFRIIIQWAVRLNIFNITFDTIVNKNNTTKEI